jgi:hypothetical protein
MTLYLMFLPNKEKLLDCFSNCFFQDCSPSAHSYIFFHRKGIASEAHGIIPRIAAGALEKRFSFLLGGSVATMVCKNAGIFYAGTNGTNSCYCRQCRHQNFFFGIEMLKAAVIPTNILK